jgi:hypothetical protein
MQSFATGNWGCGVFKGDPKLKFIEQWIASSMSNMQMIYYSAGDERLNGLDVVIKQIMGKYNTASLLLALNGYDFSKNNNIFEYLTTSNPSQNLSSAIKEIPSSIPISDPSRLKGTLLNATEEQRISNFQTRELIDVSPDLLNFIGDQAKLVIIPNIFPTNIILTRQQILSILCYTYFASVTGRLPYLKIKATGQDFKFDWANEQTNHAKMSCIKNYFKLCKEHPEILKEEVHIFKLSINANEPLVNFKQCPLIKPIIKTDVSPKLEKEYTALQADFANKNIGGSVLEDGCAQEEIRFVISPECLVSLLFMETMKDNESICILNTIQYSDYTGYGLDKINEKPKPITEGFRFDKHSTENLKLHRTNIVAIDALDYRNISKDRQYSKDSVRREIIKCLAGLKAGTPPKEPTTALGKGIASTPISHPTTAIIKSRYSSPEPTTRSEASTPIQEPTNTNAIFSKLNLPLVLGTIAGVVVAASFAGGRKSKKRRKIGKFKNKTKKI